MTRRIARRRTSVVAGAAILLVLAGCGSGHSKLTSKDRPHSSSPSSTSTTRPAQHPARKTTPPPSTVPASTTTTGPAVPVQDQTTGISPEGISAISFLSLRDGFGLYQGAVVFTNDGGLTWGGLSAAQQTELPANADDYPADGILFDSQQQGFVWNTADQGRSLSVTSDGGRDWRLASGPTDVQTVLADGSSVWAVSGSPADAPQSATPVLWESSDDGATWLRSPTPLPVDGSRIMSATRGGATTGYIVEYSVKANQTTLLETSDAGRSWTTRTVPAAACGMFATIVQAVTPSDLWLACGDQPFTGNQYKAVYRSTDSGQTWKTVAANLYDQAQVGGITGSGYLDQFYAASDTTAYIALGRGPIIESKDSGATWKSVASNYDTGSFDPVLAPPVNPTTGVALVSGQSWSTTNGMSWAPTT